MSIVNVSLGERVRINHPELVNMYGCTIGNDCVIGSFVEIRKDVTIGNYVKIQAGVFIPEGVTIEDRVFIGPHVCFTNDYYPRSTNLDGSLQKETDWKLIPTIVKRHASIGANVTIRCGVIIGEGAMIGVGSVVLHDVPPWTVIAGNPAKTIRELKPPEKNYK